MTNSESRDTRADVKIHPGYKFIFSKSECRRPNALIQSKEAKEAGLLIDHSKMGALLFLRRLICL